MLIPEESIAHRADLQFYVFKCRSSLETIGVLFQSTLRTVHIRKRKGKLK